MTTERQPTELNLNSLFDALRRPLDLIEDAERRTEIERILESSRADQERAVFELLSDMAATISASENVSVVLEDGGILRIVEVEAPAETPGDEAIDIEGDKTEPISIRLPRALKAAVDTTAAASGTSANALYVWAAARAVGRGGGRGRDLRERVAGRGRDLRERIEARGRGRGERDAGGPQRDARGPHPHFFHNHEHHGRGGFGGRRGRMMADVD